MNRNVLLIFVLVMFLSSCSYMNNNTNLPYEETANEQSVGTLENREEVKNDKITKVLIPEEELVYKNEINGYQITFPKIWKSYYVITEYSSGNVCIGFYGDSKTGQEAYKHSNGRDGLDMFWILEKPPENGPILGIGKVNEMVYYFGMLGGAYIPTLKDISNPDSLIRSFVKYSIDETELVLASEDYKRAIQMQEDIESIIGTLIQWEPNTNQVPTEDGDIVRLVPLILSEFALIFPIQLFSNQRADLSEKNSALYVCGLTLK